MNIRKGSWIEILSQTHQLSGFVGKIEDIKKVGNDLVIKFTAMGRIPDQNRYARFDVVIRYPDTNYLKVAPGTVHDFRETESDFTRLEDFKGNYSFKTIPIEKYKIGANPAL